MHSSSPEHPDQGVCAAPTTTPRPTDSQLLTTLFDLGRQVTAVLNLDELLQRIPQMISRLTEFSTAVTCRPRSNNVVSSWESVGRGAVVGAAQAPSSGCSGEDGCMAFTNDGTRANQPDYTSQ